MNVPQAAVAEWGCIMKIKQGGGRTYCTYVLGQGTCKVPCTADTTPCHTQLCAMLHKAAWRGCMNGEVASSAHP